MTSLLCFPFYKIPLSFVSKKVDFIKTPPLNVVFAVTGKCNSKCRTCFVWQHQNGQDKELTLDEYQSIFQSMAKTYWVTVGGGEPFLREDLLDIIVAIRTYLKPRIINIVSNGSLPKKIVPLIRSLAQRYGETQFIVNFSIDHIQGKHDRIRGLDGSFELVLHTIRLLKNLRQDNVSLGVHSVISKYNLGDFPFIYTWIQEHVKPDFYIIEDAQRRKEYLNEQGDFFESELDYLKAVQYYLAEIRSEKMNGINRMKKAFRMEYYHSVKRALLAGRRPYDCYAGYSSCQVNPDGAVWACATKGFMLGSLRKYNYNFNRLWASEEARRARERIKQEKCICHLSNVSYTNMLFSPSRMFSVLTTFIRN